MKNIKDTKYRIYLVLNVMTGFVLNGGITKTIIKTEIKYFLKF